MLFRKNQIYLIIFILAFFRLSLAIAEETLPQNTVERILSSIINLKTEKQLSPNEIKENDILANRALALLDMREISLKALGKYWNKRSLAEQKIFTNLLSRMFLKEAFPSSGKFFSNLELTYGQTSINKSQAIVPLIVIHKKEGEVSVNFHLNNNRGQWRLVDVDLDQISMRNNLRSQFYKVISKNDYQELVRRMKKKLADIKS
jgi:phospholipid transport system substrate-binding protein